MDTLTSITQQLMHQLWKKSTLDHIDIRIQPRVTATLLFPKPALYLVLETIADPCVDASAKHTMLAPVWVNGDRHEVELLAAELPFWVVAIPAEKYQQLARMEHMLRELLRHVDTCPADTIYRWRVSAAT